MCNHIESYVHPEYGFTVLTIDGHSKTMFQKSAGKGRLGQDPNLAKTDPLVDDRNPA